MTAKLGTSTAKFRLGYGAPESVRLGSDAAWEASGEFVFTTTTPNGYSVLVYATSTTGYWKVVWWDNTTAIRGNGDPEWEGAASVESPNSSPKTVRVFSCTAAGVPSGGLTYINLGYDTQEFMTAYDFSECRTLTSVALDAGPVFPSLTVGQLPLLWRLAVSASTVRLDKESLPALSALILSGLTGASVDASNLPLLAELSLFSCESLDTISLANTPALSSLFFSNCPALKAVDFSHRGAATLSAYGCESLASIRAVGTSLDYGYFYEMYPTSSGGSNFSYNNLSAAALNQLFTDLAPTETGVLLVNDNPGSATCDPTIATAKGYIVVTS